MSSGVELHFDHNAWRGLSRCHKAANPPSSGAPSLTRRRPLITVPAHPGATPCMVRTVAGSLGGGIIRFAVATQTRQV
jgi:hypothetical protein